MINKQASIIILIILFCISPYFLFQIAAQNIDFSKDYQPLLSTGELPKTVTTPSSRKYKKQLNRINKADKRSEKKAKKEFFLASNFIIDDMLRSGYVLYNDPLGKYVNKVADVVLEKNPALRKKLEFYVLRSSSVNAFTTDQGIIFVSVGLLSQLENEAQLAFILCHEIIHYQKEHGLDLFLEVDQIDKKTSKKYVLEKSIVDKDLFKFSFSRELETEADDEGFDLFLNTNYDLASLEGVFDVLAYSYLPFDDQPFNKQFFEEAYYVFPADYQIEKVTPISPLGEEDDTESTHPSIRKRKTAIQKQVAQQSNADRVTYVLPESEFKDAQQIARFEVPLLSLHEEDYYRSIFESYLLLLEFPDNLYLKKCIAKALYLSAKYKNEGYSYDKEAKDFEGELQGLVHFMKKMSAKELSVFAATHIQQLFLEYPEDQELVFMASDALTELNFWYQLDLKDFKTVSASVESNDKSQIVSDSLYWKSAFIPYLAQENFKASWKKAEEKAANRQEWFDYYDTDEGIKESENRQSNKKKNGARLGIPKIVLVNPFYLKVDARKDNTILHEQAEKAQVDFHQILKNNAKIAGLRTTILDIEKLRNKDIEKFNELSLLNEWFTNQVNFEDLSITPGIRQNEIASIVEKYGTKYFCWTGVFSLRERKRLWPYLGVTNPIFWPFLISYSFDSPDKSLYYNIVYNIETGSREVVKFQYLDKGATMSALNSHVYDAFLQIKSK